ncbi:MAG: hypothetical protein ACOC7K_00745 [bacterium]
MGGGRRQGIAAGSKRHAVIQDCPLYSTFTTLELVRTLIENRQVSAKRYAKIGQVVRVAKIAGSKTHDENRQQERAATRAGFMGSNPRDIPVAISGDRQQ